MSLNFNFLYCKICINNHTKTSYYILVDLELLTVS